MALRLTALALSLALAAGVAAGAPSPPSGAKPPARTFTVLKSGIYECDLRGMICAACADAVTEMVLKVKGVESVEVDFDRRVLSLTVGRGHAVSLTGLRRALQRASRKIDLGGAFSIGEIRYLP